MKLLFKYLKPYKKLLIISAITDAIGVFLSLCMPYVMSEIVDGGIANGNFIAVINSSIVMLILSAVSLVSSLIANKNNSKLTTGFTTDLCKATFKKINEMSYEQYSKIGPSGLLTRVTDDIFNMEGVANTLVYTIVSVPIMFIGSVILSFLADGVLSIIFMCSIPPVILIVLIVMKPLHSMWEKADRYIDEQNKIVRERLSGLRVVRAFNNEEKEHQRAKFATEEMSKYMIRANVRSGYIEPIAMLLLNVATVVMVAVGGIRAQNGLLDKAGDIVAIVQYVALISNALINLSWTISWIPRLKVSIERINEIHLLPSIEDGEVVSEMEIDGEKSDLELKNVSFCYPKARENSIIDLSMKISQGEKIAIIGGTGSGKTTLVRLLLGLSLATSGEISLNGVAYSKIKKTEVRKRFSVALQKPMIFEGTVKENVKMGNPDATDDEILSVLNDCEMGKFVLEQEKGLEHFLVGGGQNVSGGQKQRLNMARTVIKNADVYVFDDSFSALDFLTENVIKKNLAERLKDKTQITVTQRVSTALFADKIYVLDKGRIVGEGKHEELIKNCEIYREICVSQLGKEAVDGVIKNER
ncbi:MAG: ABC transporter ATP-binding protein [Clostridia bacterium]|nr:ABC transporter ATP-binding protein [Clostridia bacterium]